MKRLTILLTAIIAMLSFICPSFAADNTGKEEMSLKREASGSFTGNQLHGLRVVNQEGIVIGNIQDIGIDSRTGKINSVTVRGLDQSNYGLAPAWGMNGKSTSDSRPEGFNSETFKDEIQNNYGLAPAWGKRDGNVWGERMRQNQSIDPSSNPSLQNLYDNVDR